MLTAKKPLFSVTITTYNHGEYIKKTIESVLNQTLQDFEIIVVDDGSPDNTKEEVESVKDERLLYVRQSPSGLPAYSRNRAIERARGKFIALLDGDDIWFPAKLERARDTFEKYPASHIVCHDVRITKESSKAIRDTRFGPFPQEMFRKLLLEGNSLGISTTVLRREVFFDAGFWFDEDRALFTIEDYDFWLRLAESGRFRFHYLPEVLAEHIVSEKSAILSNVEKNAEGTLRLFDRYAARYKKRATENNRLFRKRRASMMRSAALSHNYNGEFLKSARWFAKALGEYPLDKNSYAGLLLSLFKVRLGRI